MGGFSLLTAATTMSQYFEERKGTKEQEKNRIQDYEAYLLKTSIRLRKILQRRN